MKDLSAFIIKFAFINEDTEYNLEVAMYKAMSKYFTDEQQEKSMIQDEKNRTLVVFTPGENKHKLDALVDMIRLLNSDIIELYEDVTEKFLYKNDFSDYSIQSELIVDFIKSNITVDDVFVKLKTLGETNLTESDKEIMQEWAE